VGEFKKNAQALDNINTMLTDPKVPEKVRQIAEAYHNGTLSHQAFVKAAKATGDENFRQLQQFGKLQDDLNGFSTRFKNGQSTLETYNKALKDMTGTVAGQTIALQVTGDNTKATNDLIAKLSGTTREADGTVKGFNETQDTLNAKLRDAKAGFGAAAIQLGNVFIPALTDVTGALSNVATFLAEHKRITEAVTLAVGGMAAAWVAVKLAMAIGNTFSAITTGLGWIITKVGLTAGAYDGLAVSANAAADAEARAALGGGGGAAVGRLALGAATGVGALAYGSVAASDAYNSLPTQNDATGTPMRGRWNQNDLHRRGGLPSVGPGQDTYNPANRRGLGPTDAAMPPGAAPDPQAVADEVNRRLAASGVGPLAPFSA
jgi:hypothetical protein